MATSRNKKERLTKKQLAHIEKPDLLFEHVDLEVQKKPIKKSAVKPEPVAYKYVKPKEEERKYGEFRQKKKSKHVVVEYYDDNGDIQRYIREKV